MTTLVASPPISEILLSKSVTLPLLLLVLYKLYKDNDSSSKSSTSTTTEKSDDESTGDKLLDMFGTTITPDLTPDWESIPPIKYRPFKKGEYKLVMGINNLSAEEWLLVEDTYKDRTDFRQGLYDRVGDHLVLYDPAGRDATIEFYEMVTTFMTTRYPQWFKIEGDMIHNLIRDEYLPVDPGAVGDDINQLNKYLNTFMEEDYIILLPGGPENDDEYVFRSGCFTFAAGFDPLIKFNKPITAIHEPVPEYRTKLQSPMNKFFTKLKKHTYVRRNNWSIQVHNKILVMGEDSKGKEDEEMEVLNPDDLDFDNEVYFRSERQVLTRLPKSGAIVFTIRTYLYKMSEIREEIKREDLCDAIEGMQWSVGQYKRKPLWGDAVVKYLKGESDGCTKEWMKGFTYEY